MKDQIKTYLVSVLIAMGVGALAAYFTSDGMRSLYATILVPPLAPPAAAFPLVWTLLYALMGVSAAMIWRERNPENRATRKCALGIYALSLFVNFSWCFIFFGFRSFGFAFAWLLFLLILILKTIVEYKKINSVAAYLQIPYFIWVCFAGYLTCAIWLMN